ncbi:hypothetical protein JQ609_04840 [Bradyrhizobium sp. AUGA SZCCT0169]|uniref:hypothetical protein n=1 Tax=Bradyrhizobium sp. AUGA SZCCT0169 TaxID=2807663 RepID=UPI001BA638EC|nr:hypothetical protein [Bradyrhizobium sp. AUGA SZCCT0169]MBR1246256.1 hypothetical protein [Bradyrhizobium sp. AUGA SZCCT0169]
MQLVQSSKQAFRAAVARFDAWTSQHQTALHALRHVACFALLFGGVAHAAYHSALAQSAQATCGETCQALPGFYILAAATWGGMAVLAAWAYATLLHAFKRKPPTDGDIVWVAAGFILALFDTLLGAHSYARGEFFFAWCVGGVGLVDFFWSRLAYRQTGNHGAGVAVAPWGRSRFSWWISVS